MGELINRLNSRLNLTFCIVNTGPNLVFRLCKRTVQALETTALRCLIKLQCSCIIRDIADILLYCARFIYNIREVLRSGCRNII